MPALYDIGDVALIRGEFFDLDGNPADPDTVTGNIRRRHDGQIDDLGTFGHVDTGIWDAAYTIEVPGRHDYTIVGAGGIQQIVRSPLYVAWPGGQAPQDLTTLERCRAAYGLKADQKDHDSFMAELITAVSAQVQRLTGREFVARNTEVNLTTGERTTAPETRTFYTDGRRFLRVGDLTEITAMTIAGTSQDISGLLLLPLGFTPTRRIELAPPYSWAGYGDGAAVTITGTWGWPEIPADLEEAVVEEVCVRFQRDVATFAETFNLEESRTERPRGLASKVFDVVAGYRDPGPILA